MQSWPHPGVPSLPAHPERPRLFDTASQSLVDVGPESGTARMYVCGITPYDATHMGHANTYVSFDLLHRTWLDCGLDVAYAQNITDVDDPLLERAADTGVDWTALAHSQIDLFRGDMVALNVLPPTNYVGVVESIPLLVQLIQRLRATGLIYQVDDPDYPDWYFACSQAPGFLTHANLDVTTALEIFGERGGDPDRLGKRDPLDCLVWRLERDGEPAWESPLGRGRPGWHIGCTSIALEYLGDTFDVQGGGSDLVFPHHDMCATQGAAATGCAFARAYVHSGMVGLDGEKMSKSLGNLVLVSQLRASGVDPMAIRLVLLNHHYRSDWSWTDADLERAQDRLASWRRVAHGSSALGTDLLLEEVRAALRDDLDAPRALATIDGWVAASSTIDGDDACAPQAFAAMVEALLGVRL